MKKLAITALIACCTKTFACPGWDPQCMYVQPWVPDNPAMAAAFIEGLGLDYDDPAVLNPVAGGIYDYIKEGELNTERFSAGPPTNNPAAVIAQSEKVQDFYHGGDGEQSSAATIKSLDSSPATKMIEHIHQNSDDIIQSSYDLGLVNNDNGSAEAFEYVVWLSKYKQPDTTKNDYHYNDFNKDTIHQDSYRYFVPPFHYQKGWKQCKYLKYSPSSEDIKQAKNIVHQYRNIIDVVTTSYEMDDSEALTSQSLYEKQNAYNNRRADAINAFEQGQIEAKSVQAYKRYLNAQSQVKPLGNRDVYGNCPEDDLS